MYGSDLYSITHKMKHLFIFLIAAIASSFGSDVLEFDDSSFATEIIKHDIILVEFFAPWYVLSVIAYWKV